MSHTPLAQWQISSIFSIFFTPFPRFKVSHRNAPTLHLVSYCNSPTPVSSNIFQYISVYIVQYFSLFFNIFLVFFNLFSGMPLFPISALIVTLHLLSAAALPIFQVRGGHPRLTQQFFFNIVQKRGALWQK